MSGSDAGYAAKGEFKVRSFKTLTLALVVCATLSQVAMAASAGYVSTDRFGYTGTVTRYASLQDAQAGTAATDTVTIGNRDLALYIVNDVPSYDSDINVIMGSWWYTTDPDGRAGYGNTSGNTGIGFMQLYDEDGNTDTSLSMAFSGFDGTYYTQFDLSLTGGATTESDYGRFSVYDNNNDGGIWHSYSLNLTATGLEGQLAGNLIASDNHPTGVSGSFTGLFQLTENQTSPDNQGYYLVDLELDMVNWAYEMDQQDQLTGTAFYPSEFAVAVPLPAAAWAGMALMGALGGVAGIKRKLRRD
jgi:hypothetical protein